MTVKELRDILNKEIEDGHGKCNICTVSSECDVSYLHYGSKFTEDVIPYFDETDNTFVITD